ncbi:hypothetical protein B0J11DRAFT_578975 [Dendryphion nanum]|uniref:Uncharacterized protein n=1 Tax=Dendryphion nanum TaxID=256645 RepID=A0A9P9E187_9PLEO|nr:hypothetical protein B0J11DRAFT_578975 [Dendryphion nanum]
MSERVFQEGSIRGKTLTLPQTEGLILVSFLTLFVQFSGVCFWRVVCFILHQVRSTTASRDGLYHQQQAILRNGITAPFVLWSLIQTARVWRGKVNSSIKHSSGLISFTLIHIAFFAAAGLFSSQVTSTGANAALVERGPCGFTEDVPNLHNIQAENLNPQQLKALNIAAVLGRLTYTKASTYVRTCYRGDHSSATATCNFYVRPYLNGTNSLIKNVTCPFGNNACHNDAAQFDSGYLHSGDDLGINIPNVDSLSFRRVTTCAPIKGEENYATKWENDVYQSRVAKFNTSTKLYQFGRSEGVCSNTSKNNTNPSTTFCVSQFQKDTQVGAYSTFSATSYVDRPEASDFSPISDFRLPNADVTLVGIVNTAEYTGINDDPIFRAQRVSNSSEINFLPNNDLGVLGCTEQYQFCKTNGAINGSCTALTGLYAAGNAIERGDLNLSKRQMAVYRVLRKAAWAMSHQWAFRVLNSDVLLAQDWVFTSRASSSSSLPKDQWYAESWNLHNLSLAVFQRRVNEYAQPENFQIRPDESSWAQIIPETDPDMLALCSAQRIRSTAHYSVSVVGMSVILIVGSFLVLLDWIIVQQIFWFRSFSHIRMSKKQEWMNTGTLQLYRQTMETRGVGPWDTKDYEFPTLVARGRTFTGLGTQPDPAIQLQPVNEGGGWGYGQGVDTQYQGARYESLLEQGGGEVGGKDKK